MTIPRIWCIIMIFLLPQAASAQIDSLTASEYEQYIKNRTASPMGYLRALDSCTLLKDSIGANGLLPKLDPLYVISGNNTDLDSFLNKYAITKASLEEYRQIYEKALKAPKSEAWNKFQKMSDNDRQVRTMLNKCADSNCTRLHAKMVKDDSLHAAYLYAYVKKKGWPTIKEGSMYASLLAIHDHNNHEFYLPYLKQAVIKGEAEMSAFQLIAYHYRNAKNVNDFIKAMSEKKKYGFDVSSLLLQVIPASLPDIQKAVKEVCDQLYMRLYVFEAPRKEIYEEWMKKNNVNKLFQDVNDELQPFCKRMGIHTWQIRYMPGEKKKLTYYLLYK